MFFFFFVGRFCLLVQLSHLLQIYSEFSFLFESVLVQICVSRNLPISSKLSILLVCSCLYYSFIILFISVKLIVMSLLLFLILVIWVFSSFFFFCLFVSQGPMHFYCLTLGGMWNLATSLLMILTSVSGAWLLSPDPFIIKLSVFTYWFLQLLRIIDYILYFIEGCWCFKEDHISMNSDIQRQNERCIFNVQLSGSEAQCGKK